MSARGKKSQKERKKPTIGRRTGINVVASKRIKLQFDGLEDYHGYWTPSENNSSCETTPKKLLHSSPKVSNVQRLSSVIKDSSINVKNELNRSKTLNEASNSTDKVNSFINESNNQFSDERVALGNTIAENNSPALKKFSKKRKQSVKGRRTGVDMFRGKNIKIGNGVENYEDYWTDSESEISTFYQDKKFRFSKSRIKESYDGDLIPSSSQRKSPLLTTNETEMQTRLNCDTYQTDCMTPSSTSESPTLKKSVNISRRKANFVTTESSKSSIKNVLHSMNDNSDINEQFDDTLKPSKNRKSLRKNSQKILSQRESFSLTEVQNKSNSDTNNRLDFKTSDGTSESLTPKRSKNVSNSDPYLVTFESNNKSFMRNVAASMSDNVSDTADQPDVTYSHDALSTPSKNKSLRNNLKKNFTEKKSLLMTTNETEIQTKSSSDVNNHLDCIISDGSLESTTPEINENVSNRDAYSITSESRNKSPVNNVIVSINDDVSDIGDQSEVIDSHDAIESTHSKNKYLRKGLKKNLTQRKSLFMSTDVTERQTKSSSNANNNLDNIILDGTSESSTLKRNKNVSNKYANLVTLESNNKSHMKNVATSMSDNDFETADQSDVTDSHNALSTPSKNKKSLKIKKNLTERKSLLMTSNDTEMQTKSSSNANNHLNYITSDSTSESPTLKNVEIPMDDNVSDMQDLSDVIDSHDKVESSSSKNKSLNECLGTISSKNNTENMHSEASNDSHSITGNDPFDSHSHYTLELRSLRKSKTLKENSKAITPKQYDTMSKRHLDLSSSKSNTKSFAESIDSGANENPSVTNHSLKSASFKKKKLNNLKTPRSKSNKKSKQKIFNSAQSICNSDGKTITREMFLQNSDDQYSSSEQNSNTTERSLIKTSMRSGRNKNTTPQQSRNKNANKSLVNNLSSNSISDEAIKDLKSQQNKIVTCGTTSKMPKSQSKTKTSLSKKDSENLIIQSVEPCVRRSTRTRVPPLDHWRNERRQITLYKREVIWEKGDEDFITERFKNRIRNNVKKNKTAKIRKLPDNTINLKHIQNTLDPVAVINPNTGDEEDVYVHRPFNTLLWSSPQSQDSNHASYQLTKCIAGEPISFGYIDINFKKKKEKQYSPTYNIAFSVIKGKVKVTINKSKIILEPLDVITVPCSNTYSIDNIGSTNALLFFCTFMAPIFKYQLSRS